VIWEHLGAKEELAAEMEPEAIGQRRRKGGGPWRQRSVRGSQEMRSCRWKAPSGSYVGAFLVFRADQSNEYLSMCNRRSRFNRPGGCAEATGSDCISRPLRIASFLSSILGRSRSSDKASISPSASLDINGVLTARYNAADAVRALPRTRQHQIDVSPMTGQ
jgi:hypothetical protein